MSGLSSRIIHLITGLAGGGAERALLNLLRGSLADKFECHVVSLGGEDLIGPKIRALQVPVTMLEMPRGRPSFSGVMKLRRLIKEQQPDVLQGWMYHGNAAALLGQKFATGRPRLIWNIRQTLYSLTNEKPITRQVIRANRIFSSMPEAIIYNSHRSRKQHEEFGFNAHGGQVIPNGIDIDQYSYSESYRQWVRSNLGIPASARVVGHIARLHPMKDHRSFLGAAVQLARRP